MSMKINPSILPVEQAVASGSKSSGIATPSPQELQAKIEEGIQKAAHNLDHIMGSVTGNATLAPVDVAIQKAMNQIQNKKRDEDEIKDALKSGEESRDSQLQKAAERLEQTSGAVAHFGDH